MFKKIAYYLSIIVGSILLAWIINVSEYGPKIFTFMILLGAFLIGRISVTPNEFTKDYGKIKALEKCAMIGKYNFNDLDELRTTIAKHFQTIKISQDEADFLIAKLDKIDLREKERL